MIAPPADRAITQFHALLQVVRRQWRNPAVLSLLLPLAVPFCSIPEPRRGIPSNTVQMTLVIRADGFGN